MYPILPYPGYSWSMNHHMGVVNERSLQAVVWAANFFRQNNDPVYDINNYLVANNIFTSNIRSDSGQSDAWRDYQQILSELGLIISTKIQKPITLTSIGLAFIERTISYNELVTLQALRYQYPNGHRTTISTALRKQLKGTSFQDIETLTELQTKTGIKIRPAVLVWRVLRELSKTGEIEILTIDEVQKFLLPCINHNDIAKVVSSIIIARKSFPHDSKSSRDIQEWFRFLLLTPLFTQAKGYGTSIKISDYGIQMADQIDDICIRLEDPQTFWVSNLSSKEKHFSWYAEYGSIDLNINIISDKDNVDADFNESRKLSGTDLQAINLRPFNPDNLFQEDQDLINDGNQKTQIIYDASISSGQYILHDSMIKLIAEICGRNGGKVFDDPKSLDLLIGFQNYEFMVEVKSVTPRNFVQRIRLALGQLLHYDYLRSLQSQVPRRKVLALAARVSSDSWCIPFLNNHLNIDLLSLGKQGLDVNSNFGLSQRLFTIENPQNSLF